MSGGPDVLVRRHDHTLVLTLNRPHAHNAMTGAMATEIGEWLDRADADPGIRAVVVTGAGDRAFCAGGDLDLIRRGESIHSTTHPRWGFAGLRRHFVSTPLIAAVNGFAVGGGFEMVLASDLAVASRTAWFSLPEGRHGFAGNPGGAFRLGRQLPAKVGLDLVLTGRRLSAEAAHARGLVNRLTGPDDVLPEAMRLAGEVASGAPMSVAASKRISYGTTGGDAEDERAVWPAWEAELGGE